MKMCLAIAVALIGWRTAAAQAVIGTELLAAEEIKPWIAASANAYVGSYHFGLSECESIVTISIRNGVTTATRQYTDIKEMHLVTKLLTHVRIAGNKFYSDQMSGEFVLFTEVEGRTRGLRVAKPWSCSAPKGKSEIGARL